MKNTESIGWLYDWFTFSPDYVRRMKQKLRTSRNKISMQILDTGARARWAKNDVCASRAHYRHVWPIQLYIVRRYPGSAYLFCFDWFLIFVSSCERNQAKK
jgi:hypothetical protein